MILIDIILETAAKYMRQRLNQRGELNTKNPTYLGANKPSIALILHEYTNNFAILIILPSDRVTHDIELVNPISNP